MPRDKKPHWSAVHLGRFEGQLSVFKMDGKSACYRCFVPQKPPEAETCTAVGVVGALAGINRLHDGYGSHENYNKRRAASLWKVVPI